MSIVYATNKMNTLLRPNYIIEDCVNIARSAMGADKGESDDDTRSILTGYRDVLDLYCVTARDDTDNSLVGLFGFGDLSQYPMTRRGWTPPSGVGKRSESGKTGDSGALASGAWVESMLDAIEAKSINLANVDAATSIYVHADYKGQRIGTTMMAKRATFQIARGITHAVSFMYETTEIKDWSAGRTSAEEIATDDDGDKVYLFDLSELSE
tara:strand:+ start:968 stop:1600 length:633 start_codon:yes stop_codon:yes gene_type:complete